MSDSLRLLLGLLLDRAARGDRDAFMRFYDLTASTAWRLAMSSTSDTHDAEDAIARAYRQVWDQVQRTSSVPRNPVIWLLSFVHTHARPDFFAQFAG